MRTMLTKLGRAFKLRHQIAKLLLKSFFGRRKVVVVELAIIGEWPYIEPVIRRLLDQVKIVVVLCLSDLGIGIDALKAATESDLIERIIIASRDDLRSLSKLFRLDAFVTSEQFSDPLFHPAICIFHGQPSKGLTFNRTVVERFGHFCILGPLHEKAFEIYLTDQSITEVQPIAPIQRTPKLHRSGYPKSDVLIRKYLETDRCKMTVPRKVLYAPAFNALATLRTNGLEILRAISGLLDVEIIVKLAPDSIESQTNFHATGGVNWTQKIAELNLSNVTVAKDLAIDPYLDWADVMLTDVSGVAMEMFAIGKPVVFYDCPDFYRAVWSDHFRYLEYETFVNREIVNVMREHGRVISDIEELLAVLSCPLTNPDGEAMRRALLYHAGSATSHVVRVILDVVSETK